MNPTLASENSDVHDVLRRFRASADGIMLGTLVFLFVAGCVLAAVTGSWMPLLVVGVPSVAVPAIIVRSAPGTTMGRLAIASASREISSFNLDLSARTEDQAS